jgi:predicted cupin superfamily sugar epimerase
MMTVKYLIDQLDLLPHPEGGFYRETYRSAGILSKQCLTTDFAADRHYATAIYFLLKQGDFSAFHRIKSDECWHFYEGDALLIHVIDKHGHYYCTRLGRKLDEGEVYQFVVPAGAWFASEPAPHSSFTLVGCTVAPGFDFADFEMADAAKLVRAFPQHRQLVERLCR